MVFSTNSFASCPHQKFLQSLYDNSADDIIDIYSTHSVSVWEIFEDLEIDRFNLSACEQVLSDILLRKSEILEPEDNQDNLISFYETLLYTLKSF